MRYAVLCDIHGNLEALQAVLKDCRGLNIDQFLCAGDIVGYGANPVDVLQALRRMNAVTVAGNHDWAVSGRLDFSYFTPDGQAAVMWTRSLLDFEAIAYLNQLPLSVKNKDCTLVHATLKDPANFIYMTDVSKAKETFELMDTLVCFVGHTHVPQCFVSNFEGMSSIDPKIFKMEPGFKYIVNPGSVGQPRDGNSMAAFAVYDTKAHTIEYRRVVYDIRTAQEKILAAKLPAALALRLAEGR